MVIACQKEIKKSLIKEIKGYHYHGDKVKSEE